MFCAVEVLLPAPSDRFARNAAHLFEIVKMIVLLSRFSMPCFCASRGAWQLFATFVFIQSEVCWPELIGMFLAKLPNGNVSK
jgi:hypothetical protein